MRKRAEAAVLRRRLSSSAAKCEGEGDVGVLVVAVGLVRGRWFAGVMLLPLVEEGGG